MPPAARITDSHGCPVHGGGPIVTGFPTVIIGYMPASRATDQAVCPPAVDVIVSGSPTVIIGHQQAARVGDPFAHGGVVATGCPTVIIGASGQGATLSAAAASGTPFCEECEKAKRALEEQQNHDGGRPP
jgi:uncharacterized Zn-binding protein involved in type VI secretion